MLSMTEKGTVSTAFVANALDRVSARAIVKEALSAAEISPELLASPDARIPSATYANLVKILTTKLDDEFLGQDSRRVKVGSFAMLCRAAIACHTLGDALQSALHFYRLLLNDIFGELECAGSLSWLTLRLAPDASLNLFSQEMLLMSLHRLACWLVHRRISVRMASFRYSKPPHYAEYNMMFDGTVRFDQTFTGIAFNSDLLLLPVRRSRNDLDQFLSSIPESLLLPYHDSKSTADRVTELLSGEQPHEWPAFDVVARKLSLSESTLRRRLEEEGKSYQSIKDYLRRDMAINLLSDGTQNVTDIATQLGFAEPSAFFRAFKKWTGATPGDYRRTIAQLAAA